MAKRHAEDAVYPETTVKLSKPFTSEEQNEDGSDSWMEDSGYSEGYSTPMDVDSSSSGANNCSQSDQTESFLSTIRVDEESNQDLMSLEEIRTGPKNRPIAENLLRCTIKIASEAASQQKKKKRCKAGSSDTGEESPQDCILRHACALLNSGGGILVIKIADCYSLSFNATDYSKNFLYCLDEFWKTIQPKLNALARPSTYDKVFDRCVPPHSDDVLLFISGPKHVCTMEYNLYFPGDASTDEGSYQQIVDLLQKSQARKRKQSNVDVSLKDLPGVPKVFRLQEKLNIHECKQIQLKDYDSTAIFKNHGQRDKVCKHISAFANTTGGLIIVGVSNSGEVNGLNLEMNSKQDIEERVYSMISSMYSPVNLERNVHWDMEFIPVHGCANIAVLVIKIAGMESFGGVFKKCPKSFEVQHGEAVPIEFEQWKRRMLSAEDQQANSKAMKELCSKFTKLHMSGGRLLTVRDDVQKIRDSFFTVNERFLVTPEGFETNLAEEVRAIVRQIQKNCSRDQNRGLIAASHSWLANLGGEPTDGVICDLLVISRNLGGLHLITVCQDESQQFLQYSKDVAQKIKESLVRDGGCHEKFYVSYHVVTSPDKVEPALCDDRYPPVYDLNSHRNKLNEVLMALVIILARVPSSLSNKMGVNVMNLLTKEQFQLVYQQININRELWVKGVAGTGKTLVAIELMRELQRRGKLDRDEILCVCENEGITQQIREAQVCHAVCRQTFMEHSFPEAKHVVLDEVHNYEQPDPTVSWFQKAREIVRQHDPNNPGYLWLFTDKYQKDHMFRSGIPPEHQQKPEFHLKTVIRNSGKIFAHAKKYLRLDRNTPVLGHDFKGEEVTVISYSACEKSQAEVLNETFSGLSKQGYISRDIAVLFAKLDSIPDNFPMLLNAPTCTARDNSSDKVVLSTVNKFSGLERPVVILVDLHCSIPYRRQIARFLYSAETRAMVKLFIIQCDICRNI